MKLKSRNQILFIHQQKHIGGGQTYVNELLNQVRKSGFLTQLVENEPCIKIIKKLFSTKAGKIVWSVYEDFSVFPFLISSILGKKNVIIIYGIWRLESRQTFWDDGYLSTQLRQYRHELKIWLNQFLLCLLSSGIAHLSHYSQKLFLSTPLLSLLRGKNQVIIYGGADKKLFRDVNKWKQASIRRELRIQKEDVVLLMVGRVEKRKNYIDGLNILHNLKKKHPREKIVLYIIISHGKFNDFKYLDVVLNRIDILKLGKYVRIVSGISKEEIWKFYQAADVYLMLSKELETFGLVTLEALSCGCPVFGYRACATPEIVTLKQDGFLFKPGSVGPVTDAITKYLKLSETERANLRSALVKSVSHLTWQRSAKYLIETFQ